MNHIDKMIKFEEGQLEDREIVALFQDLLDNENAWQLQGSYARVTKELFSPEKTKASYPAR